MPGEASTRQWTTATGHARKYSISTQEYYNLVGVSRRGVYINILNKRSECSVSMVRSTQEMHKWIRIQYRGWSMEHRSSKSGLKKSVWRGGRDGPIDFR